MTTVGEIRENNDYLPPAWVPFSSYYLKPDDELVSQAQLRHSTIASAGLYALRMLSTVPSCVIRPKITLDYIPIGVAAGFFLGTTTGILREACWPQSYWEDCKKWAVSYAAEKPAVQVIHGTLDAAGSIANGVTSVFWGPDTSAILNGVYFGTVIGYNGARTAVQCMSEAFDYCCPEVSDDDLLHAEEGELQSLIPRPGSLADSSASVNQV